MNARVIHQMWSPRPEGYAERREVAFGEGVKATTLASVSVETKGLNG